MLKPANTKRSASQGIVCECCINRCSKSEMLEYCAEPEKRRKRSLLLRASSTVSEHSVIRSQADVDEFYRQLDEEIQESSEDSSESTFDLKEFENQPLIQLLEQQKEINIQQAKNSKRNSGEDNEQRLKDYLRAKYRAMLSDNNGFYPTATQKSIHSKGSDYSLLYHLYELFKDEQPKNLHVG